MYAYELGELFLQTFALGALFRFGLRSSLIVLSVRLGSVLGRVSHGIRIQKFYVFLTLVFNIDNLYDRRSRQGGGNGCGCREFGAEFRDGRGHRFEKFLRIHRTSGDLGVDSDHFFDGEDFRESAETIDEKLDLRFLSFGEVRALSRGESRHRACADRDQYLGAAADIFQFLDVLGARDRSFDEGDVERIHDVLGLQDADVPEIEDLFPFLPMVVHELGEHDR